MAALGYYKIVFDVVFEVGKKRKVGVDFAVTTVSYF
jgi:hypothetical protein